LVIEKFPDECKCPPNKTPWYEGLFDIFMGKVGLRTAFTRTVAGLEIDLNGTILTIPDVMSRDFTVRLPKELLPDIAIFLGDVHGKHVNAIVSKCQPPEIASLATLTPHAPIAK
jgi:hypothetical protein